MDKLVYLSYPILLLILLWGARFYPKKDQWNEGFLSLEQTKALQGFMAICILFHHMGQKTCAPWHKKSVIVHGLDLFVPIGYFFVGVFLFCSGYGLYKSYKTKEHYLKGFFPRRVMPLVVGYYLTGFIFLGVRFAMKEPMSGRQILYYITGVQLSNPNAWFAIALPIFYTGFYFAFRFCKSEKTALFVTGLVVFVYTMIGTIVDHNNFWMRGEWWYNCVHLFTLGLLFARYEKPIVDRAKKGYWVKLILCFLAIFVFFRISEVAQNVLSYYGENFHANFKVLRRWGCLVTQMAASCAFVFFLMLLTMKLRIGNRVLKFMGTMTLEFYLIHGLFIELFGYSFLDVRPSIVYIKNAALFIVVVVVCSVPAAILLKKVMDLILKPMQRPAAIDK